MSEVRIVPLSEFVAVEEPSAEPLLGVRGETVLSVGGRLLMYGEAGSGKTTLTVDAIAHLAAGIPWLEIEVSRPQRVLVIENEGPRGMFRQKLGDKLGGWDGRPFVHNVYVLEEPWTGFTFAEQHCTDPVVTWIERHEIDVLVAGPLVSLGTIGGGTPSEVEAFTKLLDAMKAGCPRTYAEWLVHHENKSGAISGAWDRVPDILLHVQGRGNGHTSLRIEKARWASARHDTTLALAWSDGKGFTIEDRSPVSADTMADDILAAVREQPGISWTQLREHVTGNREEAAKVRDGLLRDGVLVNTATREGYFNLHLTDDTDASRSELRTDLERATFPSGGADAERAVPPFPSIGERRTERDGPPGTTPTPGDPEFLPAVYARFERGEITEEQWHLADRADRQARKTG